MVETLQQRLEAAVAQAETNAGLMHDVVHGGPTETVTTEGGPIDSLAKRLAALEAAYAALDAVAACAAERALADAAKVAAQAARDAAVAALATMQDRLIPGEWEDEFPALDVDGSALDDGDLCYHVDTGNDVLTGMYVYGLGEWKQLGGGALLIASLLSEVAALGSTAQATARTNIGAAAASVMQGFRLTLSPGAPVPSGDVIGASTLYLAPFAHGSIALYSGGAWVGVTSAEVALALSGLTTGRPYDVFAYISGSAVALELIAWTNSTARAVALARQDGVRVKSGDPTRRYVGTIVATSATTTEDSAANRYVWNADNRAARPLRWSGTSSWTYNAAAWRQAGGLSSALVKFVCGEPTRLRLSNEIWVESVTSGDNAFIGIGIDSTSAPAGGSGGHVQIQTAGRRHFISCQIASTLSPGQHYAAALEYGVASGTETWTQSALSLAVSGLIGEVDG